MLKRWRNRVRQAEPPIIPEDSRAGQIQSKPLQRILVVDGEEPIREIVSSMLGAAGYEAQEAESGMEALAILKKSGEFELMVTELMMPNVNGMALLEVVREKYPDMPVLMLTGVNDISVALAVLRNGAYDYLLKPFEREQLVAAVRRGLDLRRLKLETRAYQSNLESIVKAKNEQLQQVLADLERSYNVTLEALGDLLDLKDPVNSGHAKHVTAYAIAIARAMGLPAKDIKIIARGVFLHDVGKLVIPDEIIRKTKALTVEETAVMREHCFRGYQMLQKIPFLKEIGEIVYAHEERFDGKGYPRGLRGEEIPLGARICAVAELLDAVTSDWPFGAAQTVAAAKEKIRRCSGTQFDPEVVDVFLQMPETTWENLRKAIDARYSSPSTLQ